MEWFCLHYNNTLLNLNNNTVFILKKEIRLSAFDKYWECSGMALHRERVAKQSKNLSVYTVYQHTQRKDCFVLDRCTTSLGASVEAIC